MTKKKTKRKASKKRVTKKKTIKAKVVIPKLELVADEILKPSNWFNAVQKQENVSPTHIWHVNKEKIFEDYNGKFWSYWDRDGKPIRSKEKPDEKTYGHQHARLITVLPDGKIITPIRQFCEFKSLPLGVREAFFYDFGPVSFPELHEGQVTPTVSPQITSTRAETIPRGTRIDIGYNDVEDSSTDIIASANRSFALESINDENIEVMQRTFNDDTHSIGETDMRLKGGGLKVWIDNYGNEIKGDDWMIKGDNPLTLKAVFSAIGKIQEEGLDTTNAVMYTNVHGMIQLIDDPEFKERNKHSLLESTQFLLEKILGIKIIVSSACPTTDTINMVPIKETYWKRFRRVLRFKKQPMEAKGKICTRTVLFLPNIAFGLVGGETLTMEAQRRNERQVITLTGTQRISGVLKNRECAVRISHA